MHIHILTHTLSLSPAEIIDKKLLICSRQQNPILGTVDFVENQRQNHPPTSSNKKRAREAAESNLNVGSGSSSSSPLLVSSPPPGKVCLRVHPKERGKLILQLGTSDPDLAVKAALIA